MGSPNAGKTSVFNHLTGLRAKTGNYPGVTVSRSVGTMSGGSEDVVVEDLPGTYSLSPVSPDEEVVSDVLAGRHPGVPSPDALALVVDATTLGRSLSLVAEAMALGHRVALVVTMTDELSSRGGRLDLSALSAALGVPVVGVVGSTGLGIDALRDLLADVGTWQTAVVLPPVEGPELDSWTESVLTAADYSPAHADTRTQRVDAVLLHPVWGTVVFFAVMFAFFQVIFAVAAPLQDLVQAGFDRLAGLAAQIPDPLLAGLVGNGVVGGVGAALVFLPQIMLLFLLISLLESVGYMSRAAFLMDRVMAKTGLEGRAFVSMLSSFACAVPGIMATRTIPSSRDRIATIMALPLMTCSARLPVFILLTGLLVPAGGAVGPLDLRGVVLFGLYLLGGFSSLVVAALFKATALRDHLTPFYMEMPPYRLPSMRSVLVTMWASAQVFLRKVARIIFATTMVLWLLLNLPVRPAETEGMDATRATTYTLEHSYAAQVGHAIEPVFEPLGFDWRIDVGLLGALSAREVFVSTLGQVSAAQNPDDPQQALSQARYTDGDHEGERVFTPPTVVALLVFFVYALQCMSTIAVMRRETNSWRWPLVAVSYMFVLAWGLAFVARHITQAILGA
ncbi:MAG TPA: ferrous iron transporter B [Nocardioidaceae bacterium]|nr:ferrous iron transporter B [Nocardioidaceae bacterium]